MEQAPEQLKGREIFEASQAAQEAFQTWLDTTYPNETLVEFAYYGTSRREGRVAGRGFDRADEPYIYVLHAKGSTRVNPLTDPVKVLPAATPQAAQ